MMKSWCLVVLGLWGCAAEVEVAGGGDGDGDGEGVSAQPLGGGCNDLICPGNSDIIAALGPFELDAARLESSSRGFRIAGIKLGGHSVLDLQIDGTAVHAMTSAGMATGPGIIGMTMTLSHKSGATFDLVVDGYLSTKVPYYAGGPNEIEGYHIAYREPATRELKDICPYKDYDAGVARTWAVFWKGDRYDPDTGLIYASGAAVGSWFNLSCAGEATIKMLRARTGGAVAPGSPVAQRQATLNMFTASYCGATGQRYTELGQDLAWSDLSGPSQMGPVASHEAIWSESGAVCLSTPRLYPLDKINCAIPRPPCTAAMIGDWESYGWLVSGNP